MTYDKLLELEALLHEVAQAWYETGILDAKFGKQGMTSKRLRKLAQEAELDLWYALGEVFK